MNNSDRPESNFGHDMLVGQNNDRITGNIKWCTFNSEGVNKKLETNKNFITVTGGGYFFCPSILEFSIIQANNPFFRDRIYLYAMLYRRHKNNLDMSSEHCNCTDANSTLLIEKRLNDISFRREKMDNIFHENN